MHFVTLCILLLVLAACGSEKAEPENTPTPPAANTAPTISGTPATAITQDQDYSFTPAGNDLDGDVLTYSISVVPTWAAFEPTTGTLAGQPLEIHVGTTPDITISVTDGQDAASLAPFDLEVLAIQLGSASVSWEMPTTNADGSELSDLAGYRVHYGLASGSYNESVDVNDASITFVQISDLEPGTWFFAVTAIDHSENESVLSAEVLKVVAP
jgi:hypothetical protein